MRGINNLGDNRARILFRLHVDKAGAISNACGQVLVLKLETFHGVDVEHIGD